MNAFAKVFGWASIVGAFLLFPAASGAELLGAMRVRLVEGDVQVKIAETGEWAPASVNMPLVEGDELWVPEESLSAIQTNNGAYVRLDGNTALQVLRVDRNSFQFSLPQGRAYVLNNALRPSVLQFDTPDTSIRTFGKSTFRIDIPDGETDVLVFRGSVTAENAGGTTKVRAGSMLVLGSDGYAELSPLPPPDGWQEWNERRDRVALARGEGYRHLPDELRVYSSDLDENGRWVNVPEYGYVWTPTVVVTGDWAPYRHGRWVWRGGDYVWVGYEPWGWAPYHYGRWAFAVNIGWLWVPPARGDVFWAPGYVGWVRTGDHVAWVPLAPREVYYGRGNYGRYSTNITNVNITQVRVTNVYRNVNVTNSITVVNQTTFVTGRPSSVDRNVVGNVREDFAKRRNIVVGSPPIKPVETSYVPVVRQIPEAKRPPTAVRKIDVKELRQTRPLVKEPGRSAIRPQAQPRPLEVKKVEKPRSLSERTRERQQAAPPERGRTQEAPAERARPQETAPPEKARPQVTPAEKGRPQEVPAEKGKLKEAPPERGRTQEAPAERGRPQQTAPPRKARPQVAPAERGRPQEAPAEKGKLKEAPAEKGKSKEAPPDNVLRENPRGGTEREGEKGRR
ncbi:MAG: FecR domain protein [Deltaproteobacteria bacterium CSP1-8]|nr:MAG: FecR domain protein [Deltaproteobacteria bacterium CSP1-8]